MHHVARITLYVHTHRVYANMRPNNGASLCVWAVGRERKKNRPTRAKHWWRKLMCVHCARMFQYSHVPQNEHGNMPFFLLVHCYCCCWIVYVRHGRTPNDTAIEHNYIIYNMVMHNNKTNPNSCFIAAPFAYSPTFAMANTHTQYFSPIHVI